MHSHVLTNSVVYHQVTTHTKIEGKSFESYSYLRRIIREWHTPQRLEVAEERDLRARHNHLIKRGKVPLLKTVEGFGESSCVPRTQRGNIGIVREALSKGGSPSMTNLRRGPTAWVWAGERHTPHRFKVAEERNLRPRHHHLSPRFRASDMNFPRVP